MRAEWSGVLKGVKATVVDEKGGSETVHFGMETGLFLWGLRLERS